MSNNRQNIWEIGMYGAFTPPAFGKQKPLCMKECKSKSSKSIINPVTRPDLDHIANV